MKRISRCVFRNKKQRLNYISAAALVLCLLLAGIQGCGMEGTPSSAPETGINLQTSDTAKDIENIVNYEEAAFNRSREEEEKASREAAERASREAEAAARTLPAQVTYVGNANTHKFHYPKCSSVDQMAEHNKVFFYGGREEPISQGYKACKRCNP